MSDRAVYKRVLLKLSGEALLGEKSFGIDRAFTSYLAAEIRDIHSLELEVAVVVGGGNIFRGVSDSAKGMDRVAADHMGMLATVINGIALQDALEREGIQTRVLSAIEMREVAEPFIRRRAMRHLEKGRVVILAGGLGSPFFTTDTPAALRAAELGADAVLKGTHSGVDGVYTADPKLDPTATKLDEVTYLDVINKGLNVMDITSITFCMDNHLPIVVFNVLAEGNLRRVLEGEAAVGTLVR